MNCALCITENDLRYVSSSIVAVQFHRCLNFFPILTFTTHLELIIPTTKKIRRIERKESTSSKVIGQKTHGFLFFRHINSDGHFVIR